MSSRSKYRTKQRDVIRDYLETVPGVHITAGEICDGLREIGTPVGQTTVYRQLERLVDEGLVNKYIIDGNTPACFEYVPAGNPVGNEVCFHCKCEKCGKLIHLHCGELEDMQNHLQTQHQFTVNPLRTVFYGLCPECGEPPERTEA